MTITMTLKEILDRCNNWEEFCERFGWSEWAVNEGGGDIVQVLTEEEAEEFGII